MRVFDLLIFGIYFGGLLGFGYSWYFLYTSYRQGRLRWREWVSPVALGLASLAAASWFGMAALMPSVNWATGSGVERQINFANKWAAVVMVACSVAFVLGLVGRPRLVVPIALACLGTATFFILSTMT